MVELLTTEDLLSAGDLPAALAQVTSRLSWTMADRARADDEKAVDAIAGRKKSDRALGVGAARRALGGLVPRYRPDGEAAAVHPAEVLQALAEAAKVTLTIPKAPVLGLDDTVEALRSAAAAAGIRLRQIRLGKRWWRHDHGPLIGRRAGVLLPIVFRRGRYHLVDPLTKARTPVGAATAASLEDTATLVRFPLPAKTGMWRLFRAGLAGTGSELRRMLGSGIVVAAASLAAPIFVGGALGDLATGESAGLTWSSALYLASALVAALLTIVLNLRTLRFEDRLESGIQLALWDRLLRLPTTFFTRSSGGVLANKFVGIAYARQAVNGLVTSTLLAFLTACAGIGLLIAVGTSVAWIAVILVVGTTVVSTVLAVAVARRQRAALPAEHHLAAVTTEMLHGIAKVKLADAGSRAFGRWADAATAARLGAQRVGRVQAFMAALSVTLPLAGPFVLVVVLPRTSEDFFTVNAGFVLLIQALTTILSASIEFVAVLPRFDGVAELLAEPVEGVFGQTQPGRLQGGIEVRGVKFAYPSSLADVVDDVSFEVRPGEFVAIVGPSGSGKSTLLRLLLGFERPAAGSIRYDDQDLTDLDLSAVRRQCGVVLQDGQLFAGTIRENICGAAPLGIAQVWEAAQMAGIDVDIGRMPMGLNSLVPFGGGTLSVGQRQRVLIARALAPRPRLLFFDEATSALDNRAQEKVTASTRRLAATRVVIAHRLSSVRNADRILVMDHGRIVQSGSFDELLADADGLFYRLARRQMVGPEPVSSGAADGRTDRKNLPLQSSAGPSAWSRGTSKRWN
ncbi:ATP-binding cassette domain-containing protein [Amycolatopsis japonica]|uniref:ATP-binding cassette domain-containing protein n=1 Tax=Amycolatopsis japonica TaxID=208439 RepID=UPI00332DA1B5